MSGSISATCNPWRICQSHTFHTRSHFRCKRNILLQFLRFSIPSICLSIHTFRHRSTYRWIGSICFKFMRKRANSSFWRDHIYTYNYQVWFIQNTDWTTSLLCIRLPQISQTNYSTTFLRAINRVFNFIHWPTCVQSLSIRCIALHSRHCWRSACRSQSRNN